MILSKARVCAQNARDWLRLDEELLQAERTPYELLARSGIASVRYYAPLEVDSIELSGETIPVARERHAVPVVLVAPLAVNMRIYDLFPERSLVRYLLARGFSVYLVDWGSPTRAEDHHRLATYFEELLPGFLEAVRAHAGTRTLSLHGWSFGGLFSYCYAAQSADPDIRNLVLVAAPCDYHANGELGQLYQRLAVGLEGVARATGLRVHNAPSSAFRVPGLVNALVFKATNPVGSLRGYLDVLTRLDDRDYVSEHATTASFLDRMEAYPGGVVQDFIEYLWSDNRVARGELPSARSTASLANVKASVLSVVSPSDPIVMPACAAPLESLFDSEDFTTLSVSGGHVGIVGGKKAPTESWGPIADWLALRSGPAVEVEAGDLSLAEAQLSRPLRGLQRVAHRCGLGLPVVLEVAPVLEDGEPFPTLYWLSCPLAHRRVARLEAAGGVRAMDQRVAEEPAFREAVEAAGASYAEARSARVSRPPRYPLRGGVGGAVGGTKCLHAHLAHHLAGGDNPVGREVAQEVLPLDCVTPCVDAQGRNRAWSEPRG